jgi:tetrahydromethanopterin S-methyltransferase subunit B
MSSNELEYTIYTKSFFASLCSLDNGPIKEDKAYLSILLVALLFGYICDILIIVLLALLIVSGFIFKIYVPLTILRNLASPLLYP